jgi:hypothetical protein
MLDHVGGHVKGSLTSKNIWTITSVDPPGPPLRL